MKKLLTILAASAMFFAFGDGINNGINFEAYTSTGEDSFPGNATAEDPVTGGQYWYSESYVGNVISNHAVTPVLPSGVTVPDMFFQDNTNTNFLYLETEKPLFRTVKTNSHDPASFEGVSITENPIYLDTLVKFTAADSAFESLEDAADKIAIEYVEHEEESHEDQTTGETVIDSAGFTNFVIRAGYLSSPIAQTNYYAAVPADFDKDAWHRLTVRSFGRIDEAGNVGFVVYLDGVPLEYDTDVEAGPGFAATGAAAAFYTDSLHALFPSAIPANQTGGQAIAAVAFSGNGSIDDVVFTTTMPEFIRTSSLVRTEITLGTGVTGVTVTVGEKTIEPEDATATTLVFNLPAGTTSFVLGVTADSANGYTFDETTGITPTDVTYDAATDTVTITGTNPALTLVGKRDNVYYMDGETKVSFATLSDAFATAPAGTTLKLGYDYVVANNEGVPEAAPVFVITKDFVLDLNGKTLNGGGSDYYYMFDVASGVTFTVIDSVEGDAGSIVYGGTKGMFTGNGDTYIGSKTLTDYGPVFEGDLVGAEGFVMGIIRGKFSAADNTYNEAFAASMFLDMDSTATLVGSYWVVEPQGGSEPKEIAVPTAIEGLVYNKSEQTGVLGGEGYTLVGNVGTNAASYTAVATLETGYAWVGGSTDPTNIVWSIDMKGVTPTIVLNPTSAQFDPNKTTVGAYVTSVAAYDGEDLLTENLDYYVSGLAEEVTEAGEYQIWVIQKAWSEGQNYMITNSQYATLTITAGGAYPTYIENITDPTTKAAYEAKYDTWKATYGADTESAYEEAFLLNCSTDAAVVAAEKAAFKFTSISYDATQSKWITTTTTKNTSNADYNGTVVVKQYSDVGCKTESSTGTFFKAFLQ